MHLTRRLTIAVVILAVAGATRAVAKPRIVYDATTVTGRDIITAKGNGKKIRVRTGDVGEDATLLGVGPRLVPEAGHQFQAAVDLDSCNGCELCLDRCYVGSIEMAPRDGDEDDLVARVDPETCLGCGLCKVVCPTEAIIMDEVRPSDFVPETFG